MKYIRIVISFLAITVLATAGTAYALSTHPSDYSQDITAGQKELVNDQAAKNQAGKVNAAENTVGQVDDSEVGVDETVGQQEGDMGQDQAGESQHGDANVSESTEHSDAGSPATDSSTSDSTTSAQTGSASTGMGNN